MSRIRASDRRSLARQAQAPRHDLHRQPRTVRPMVLRSGRENPDPAERSVAKRRTLSGTQRFFLSPNFDGDFFETGCMIRPNRQRHCVMPMIGSAIVQGSGAENGRSERRESETRGAVKKITLQSGLETLRLGEIRKGMRLHGRHSRGAMYTCSILSSSLSTG